MKALSNLQIQQYFKNDDRFGGVYSKNLLPKIMEENKAYIINVQSSMDGNGSHWVATWQLNGETVYFDSFGETIAALNIERFMKTTKQKIIRNSADLQAFNTSSCGEFCVLFCAEALKGHKFKDTFCKFTNNLVLNEHILNEYFNRESFTRRTIKDSIIKHQLSASGIRDVFHYMRRKIANAVNTVKQLVSGVREFASPPLRHYLEKYGEEKINAIKVCRRPIKSAIESVLNVLSFGQYNANKNALQYDKMFHLFLVIQFRNHQVVKLEKNHVVELSNCNFDTNNIECLPVHVRENTTLNSLLTNAEKSRGARAIYVYDSVQANCQFFCRDILSSSNMINAECNQFIMQDAESVMKHLGLLHTISKKLTDAAHMGDIIYEGQGIKSESQRKNKISCKHI